MPLFKKHHDAPVDTNYAGNPSDPNYAVASQYAPESNTYPGGAASNPHPSGVGTTLPHGNTTTDYYDSPQTAHPNAYDQSTTGYNTSTQHGSGMPVTSNHPVRNDAGRGALASEPGYPMGGHMGNELGTTGGTTSNTTTGATTGGLTGSGHHGPLSGGQNVHNTAPTGATGMTGTTGMAGTTGMTGAPGDMSSKDAKKLEMKGKAQQLAGMVLSSQSMKAKGEAKEREAAAIRHHQVNVAEAESHEAQARLARERAGPNPYH